MRYTENAVHPKAKKFSENILIMSVAKYLSKPAVASTHDCHYLTEEQIKYLRELIGISFGLGMTDEVVEGLKLINKILKYKRYYDVQQKRLNELQYLFKYEEKKGKHYL